MAMDVVQCVGNSQRDLHRPLGWKHLLLVEKLAQQPSFHPFHDHVELAAVIVSHYLHYAGMVEFRADIMLALKTLEEYRVAFHFRMRNFDGDRFARTRIRAAKDRGHAAAGNQSFNDVVVELVADVK